MGGILAVAGAYSLPRAAQEICRPDAQCLAGILPPARGAGGSFVYRKGGKWLPTSLIRPILLIRIIL